MLSCPMFKVFQFINRQANFTHLFTGIINERIVNFIRGYSD